MDVKRTEHFVRVDLSDKHLETDINKELEDYEIDAPFEIQEAMKKQSSLYFKWADMLRQAKLIKRQIDRAYEIWLAAAKRAVRKKLEEDGRKKPTKDDLSEGVIMYFKNKYNEWQNKIDNAQENIDVLDIAVRAVKDKKDMLLGVGQLCKELMNSGNLVVKDNKIGR
jgi:hypothetical protein